MKRQLFHNRPITIGDRTLAGHRDDWVNKAIDETRKQRRRIRANLPKIIHGPQTVALHRAAEEIIPYLEFCVHYARIEPSSEREWSLKISLWSNGEAGKVMLTADKSGKTTVLTNEVRGDQLRRAVKTVLGPEFNELIWPVPRLRDCHEDTC